MTLLEKLRIETRPAHDSIEQAMDLENRMTSLKAYRAVLERFYGFHASWEDRAAATFSEPDFFEPRRKADLLSRDLLALGLTEGDIADLPLCTPPVPTGSRSEVLGTMYVMEGSTLGGTIISRRMEELFGLTSENGCAYFRSYGAGVGQMWRAFRAKLEQEAHPDRDDAVVASASLTFRRMQDWICGDAPASAAA
ncbi:biliverdin-producing heme oxygenase [Microvirga pudoricolor]|uniref:biliverdin-producing heme oxygenase n=1 Tax=Microvirga pudoricolor TaxID=2778729 RepID=UPI0019525DF7|nr:biliverdin-producing heme oxygenase [Microvirga pudoricolor]MBM6596152.1 biliverdin-producing heme oxygenase [Microvirga pudoricolor]